MKTKNLFLTLSAYLVLWGIVYYFLHPLSKLFTYGLLGLVPAARLSSAVEFFVYEAPKVIMLLALVVFVVGIIRTFFTPQKTRRMLVGRKEFIGNILASLLGVVTPFCSCSSIPLFINPRFPGSLWPGRLRSTIPLLKRSIGGVI